MTSPADLYGLQEVDLRRDSRRALIADIESRLAETDELINAREEAEDTRAQVDRLRKDQRELETRIQDLTAKIDPMEQKLYSGAIHNPKELSDLQMEVESLKAQRAKLDDEALAGMEVIEVAESSAREAAEDLQHIEAAWKAEQQQLRIDKAAYESELERLDADKATRTQGMDPGTLGLYEQLRRARSGRAVARLDRGNCLGCRLTLPTNLVGRVRAGGTLVQCPSCERILVAG